MTFMDTFLHFHAMTDASASKPPSRPFPFCAVLEPLEGPVDQVDDSQGSDPWSVTKQRHGKNFMETNLGTGKGDG